MTDKNQPINYSECGLHVAIWQNQTEHGIRFNTELTRSYRDKDGNWQQTNSLREGDLLIAANVLRKAHDKIQALKNRPAPEAQAEADFESASAPEPSNI